MKANSKSYQIKVQGQLDARWSNGFGGMTMTVAESDYGEPVTTLTGPVVDQAALRGIVLKLWDLNLTLISIAPCEDSGDS
ncbi:MAG TPA: hypothetical protein VMT34_04660 [Aggregatilineales bacterium]|nr:hypothetical protein [Aggregatilineales bacterium]